MMGVGVATMKNALLIIPLCPFCLSKGRLGSVKLKGATISAAKTAPKGCRHGIQIVAPDPENKRQ